MEIGSFIELELRNTGEYYRGERDTARLNTGRSGIYYALQLMNVSAVHLPFYLCPTVSDFLVKKGIEVFPYLISKDFEPDSINFDKPAAIVIVNYFGILSHQRLNDLAKKFQNVIIDNCPSFFCAPLAEYYNVYSTRKFFGVPDGSYVVGPEAARGILEYNQDFSSDTSAFLLKRIEKGSSAVYAERMENENRLDHSDVLKMSELTRRILCSIDYEFVKSKRLENFNYTHSLFKKFNSLNIERFMDQECVPMVYPLLIEDENLVNKFKENKIYTGRWWSGVLKQVPVHCFEAYLSRFMVPIPIDQRYGRVELNYIFRVFRDVCTNH